MRRLHKAPKTSLLSRRAILVASSCEVLALGCASRSKGILAPQPGLIAIDSSGDTFAQDGHGDVEPSSLAERWIHSWVSAQQLVEPNNHPPAPGLSKGTLRQRFLLTLGGSQLRFRFSNEYGKSPLEIQEASVALPEIRAAMDVSSARPITFRGSSTVSIPSGQVIVSDSIEFESPPLTELAVTLRFGAVPHDLTGHPGSRTTSFLAHGVEVNSPDFREFRPTEHWYVLSGVEVKTTPQARALVALGDSITDGRGSTTDRNNRFPNVLAERLLASEATRNVAVLNQGIGGNRVLTGGLGPTVLDRYERDAFSISGARWVVLLCGINDLGALHGGNETPPPSAARLIEAFETIARAAHHKDVRVYGSTILPFEGSFYFTKEGEAERQKLNEWIRSNSTLDAHIDFDQITCDPVQPTRLKPEVDGGDHLHPSAEGYAIMGEAIDLSLFIE